MWLDGWHIEGFGHFSGQGVRGLPKGLVIISGPNEAGKSTLLQYVQFMLFGRQRGGRGGGELGDALAGGRLGGRLFFRDGEREVVVERLDGQVRLHEGGQRTEDAGALARWLGGMDSAMFRAVFAVRHEDLAGLGGVGGDEVRKQLMAGGISGAGRDVSDARAQLDVARTKLWRPRASCLIRGELDRVREIDLKLSELRTTAAEAVRNTAARAQLDGEVAHVRESLARNELERRKFEGLTQALEPDRELRHLDAELAELGPECPVPASLSDELDSLERDQRDVDVKLTGVRQRIGELECEVQVPETDESLLASSGEIAALAELCQTLHGGQLGALDTAIATAGSRQVAMLADLELSDRSQLERVPVQGAALARLREAARDAVNASEQLGRHADAGETLSRARLAVSEAEQARDLIVVDRTALHLTEEVQLLRRETVGDQSARQRRRSLTELRSAQGCRLGELVQQLGFGLEELESVHCDVAVRAELENLAGAARDRGARLAGLEGEHERGVARVEGARVAHAPARASDEVVPESTLDAIEAGADRACAAWIEAEGRQREVEERHDDLEAVLASLGGWSAGQLERAVGALATRSELETSGHELAELERTVASRREQLASKVIPELGEGNSTRELDASFRSLAQAEALVHVANDRRARGAAPARSSPSWIWLAVLLIGAATAGMGATTASRGGLTLTVIWLLLACVLVALGLFARRALKLLGAGATLPDEDPAELTKALRAAGLAADAGIGQIAAARAELESKRAAASDRTSMERERQRSTADRDLLLKDLEALEVRQSRAEVAWLAGCLAAGLESLRPLDLQRVLIRIESARSIEASCRRAATAAELARTCWTTWCASACIVAATIGAAPPNDASSARRLLEAIRKLRDKQRAAESDRNRRARDFSDAHESLARIEVELHDARQLATDMRSRLARARATGGIPDVVAGHEPQWLSQLDDARILAAQLASAAAELRDVEERVADRERRILSIAEALGIPREANDPLTEAVARCEEAKRLQVKWTASDQDAATRGSVARDATRLADQAQLDAQRARVALERWATSGGECFLPAAIAPADLEHYLQALCRARTDQLELDRLQADKAQADAQHARAEQQAGALAASVGLPYEAAQKTSRELEMAVEAARARADARRRAFAAHAEAVQVCGDLERRADEVMRSFTLLLAGNGVPTIAAARELIAKNAQRTTLSQRATELRRTRRLALGGVEDPALLVLLECADPAFWGSELDRLAAEHESFQLRRDELVRQQQVIDSDLQRAGSSNEIAQREAELGAARARLTRHRRALAELLIADELLRASLEAFRAEHQPAVLRRASGFMSQVSGGTYVGLEIDDDDHFLLVDTAGGRRPVEQLSSGTRDLLYIVLRLSLAEDLSRHYPAIPIVLDDLLVNLDTDRADQLARIIATFSMTRQVVVMSCRPETVALLLTHASEARVIELPRYAGRVTPVPGTLAVQATGRDDDLSLAAQRIHGVLGALAVTIALRKEELLQRASVGDAEWNGALKELKQLGVLEVRGKGRGSEYLLRREPVTPQL